jgi:hypothetical protein
VLTDTRHATAVTAPASSSGHTLRQIAVGPLLQHTAARADIGFVRGFTSNTVWPEYLFCPFAQCESPRVDRGAHADAAPRSQERFDERPSDTPGFEQGHSTQHCARDTGSLLVDSAISHCEKLRRVLELEEWINGTSDNPLLAATCRKWKEEREQLLGELHLG